MQEEDKNYEEAYIYFKKAHHINGKSEKAYNGMTRIKKICDDIGIELE